MSVKAELVAFTELYNVQIKVIDLFGPWVPIIKILTAEENLINMFCSEDHCNSLTSKNEKIVFEIRQLEEEGCLLLVTNS